MDKRNHYLAQRYLRGFADAEDRIWVFDRRTGKLSRDPPLKTGGETPLYRFEDAAGQVHSLEAFFTSIETKTWPTIERLDKGLDPTEEDRAILAIYTAFQFMRTPLQQRAIERFAHDLTAAEIDGVSDTEAVSNIREAMRASGVEDLPSEESLRPMLPELRAGYQLPSRGRARITLSTGTKLANLLGRMTMHFSYAGDVGAFITTESPVLLVPPPGVGLETVSFSTPGAMKIVPLSQRVLVMFLDIGDEFGIFPPTRERVDFMNATVAASARHLIIGPSEELVREMSDEAVLMKKLDG